MRLPRFIATSLTVLLLALGFGLLASGCALPNGDDANTADHPHAIPAFEAVKLAADERLQVVVTTNIVADVVNEVGAEWINLVSLIPTGADPHGFNPTPQDLITLNNAHVIFVNGLHLEEALDPVLDSLAGDVVIVSVNDGVETIQFGADDHVEEADAHEEGNPHTWFSIHAVEQWTETVAAALGALDPVNAMAYAENAEAYQKELAALEAELTSQIAEIPASQRKLVTDHGVLDYLARDFDFEMIGAVIPGLSTMAAPSARELAQLQTQIDAETVPAIFVGNTVNPGLAQQIAADIGVEVVPIYTGSLSAADGPAATYLDFMRYDVNQIVEALK